MKFNNSWSHFLSAISINNITDFIFSMSFDNISVEILSVLLKLLYTKGTCQKHPKGGCADFFLGGAVHFGQNWGGCSFTSLRMGGGQHSFTWFGGGNKFFQSSFVSGGGDITLKKNSRASRAIYCLFMVIYL